MRFAMIGSIGCLVGIVASGCTAAEPPTAGAPAPIVYGSDDRKEVFDHPDATLRSIAAQSIVALMHPENVVVGSDGSAQLYGGTLSADFALCPGERFADEPTAAFCSGTLIDDDLVLTAGHCLQTAEDCTRARFVFGYYYDSPGSFHSVTSDDVYSCRRIVVQQLSNDGGQTLDYAIAQLDRPVSGGHVPAPVSTSTGAMTVGASVSIIGFGSGLPAKIDDGGTVVNSRERVLDYFEATTDSFGGNSGSGVFDSSHQVAGILVRGGDDYVSTGACNVVNVVSAATSSAESISYVARPIGELCAMSWPSARLCGGSGGTCGDGTCAGSETSATCASDCTAGSCGDGVCAVGEDPTSCATDCAGGGPRTVPPSWTCAPGFWDALDGCDCACGPRDPDCDVLGQRVLDCAAGEICDASGACAPGPTGMMGGVPVSWTCPPSYYGTRDGCDCECGAYDPDCSDASQAVLNCGSGGACGTDGHCATGSFDGGGDTTITCAASPRRTSSGTGTGAPLPLALALVVGLALVRSQSRSRSR